MEVDRGRAADLKEAGGLTNCGVAYLNGWGVERSSIRGLMMLTAAATLGSEQLLNAPAKTLMPITAKMKKPTLVKTSTLTSAASACAARRPCSARDPAHP